MSSAGIIGLLSKMPTKVSSPPTQAFDYIICGGGTAGCVLASRLAEDPNNTILLIEAGKHNELVRSSKMPGSWAHLVNSSEDWQITSTPQKNLNDRQLKLHRGKFLGGCSGINGTLCIRGTKQDFDDWEVKGWSGEEMWRYMIEAETFHPKEWYQHDPLNHGDSGFLHTAPHDPAPITNLLLESMESQGFPYNPDMFSAGKIVHGCGHAVRTVYNGIRSVATDFTDTAGNNLWIWTEVLVDKVNLETPESGVWQAVSVDVVHNKTSYTIRARKEIIISGGAYCSPLILLRSGIGSRSETKSFGIENKVYLPGVGKNLMDHLIVPIRYQVSQANLLNSPSDLEKEHVAWEKYGTGCLSSYPIGALAYARFDSRLQDSELWQGAHRHEGRDPMGLTSSQPNIELLCTESLVGFSYFGELDKPTFIITPVLFGQQSRGTVKLGAGDPSANPVVDVNFIDDPLDLLVVSEACALANEIVLQGAGTRDIVVVSCPPGAEEPKTRDEWVPYVKQFASTSYHPAGTCKMGEINDPTAVVDERLRVHGVKNLRIADASIMPLLNNGHPQLAIYAIGMKCADMLKEDADDNARL